MTDWLTDMSVCGPNSVASALWTLSWIMSKLFSRLLRIREVVT